MRNVRILKLVLSDKNCGPVEVRLMMVTTHRLTGALPGPSVSQILQNQPKLLLAGPNQANKLRRSRRNIWDRSRADVQLETELSHWKDQWHSSNQGQQHHYDENAAMGPQDSYRYGANANCDH
uniref:Uncharacterized protein n=1 Tax=Echeneis naucrates TaxID=173247 RepID=A0A665U4D0_ECHNA